MGAPTLREGQEETPRPAQVLPAGQSHPRLPSSLTGAPSEEGELEAGVVGDVFVPGEESVESVGSSVDEDGEVVVLLDEAGGALVVAAGGAGSPPIARVSGGVEETSAVVESVGELVSDDGSDGAVVGPVGSGGEEELGREECERDDDSVLLEGVEGVGFGRRLPPPRPAVRRDSKHPKLALP